MTHHTAFELFCQPALLPYQEDHLISVIEGMLNEKKLVTSKLISKLAKDHFNDCAHIARKAAVFHYLRQNAEIKFENGKLSEEMENFADNLLKTKETHQIMEDYEIASFAAKRTWVFNFMKKHKMVFRKGHVAKRGAISQNAVEAYLNQLRGAMQRFTPDKILNMDETQVHLYSFPRTVVAKQGQTDVVYECPTNDTKTGTTYFGTIAMDPEKRFPLYCIAKGKTKICEEKYGNVSEKECIMDHTDSGWCTIQRPERYQEIHQRMIRIWESITNTAIKAAWAIPELFEDPDDEEIENIGDDYVPDYDSLN